MSLPHNHLSKFWPILINKCVLYLDWDPSNYPLLAKIRQSVERFSSLWHLALDFHENYEKWYYGPFKGLDTNIIQTQVETMYSTACQLSKTFNDSPAARRISETVRTKIEKFRTHLPVLHTLCNPGLRDRHWNAISEANGAIVKYDDSTRYVSSTAGVFYNVKNGLSFNISKSS